MGENKIKNFSHFEFPAGIPDSVRKLIDEDWPPSCEEKEDPLACYVEARRQYPLSNHVNSPEESYKAYMFCQMYRSPEKGLSYPVSPDFQRFARKATDVLHKTIRTPELDRAVTEMESHLPVIDPVSNALLVYGYKFHIKTKEPLSHYSLFQIGLALMGLGPHLARFFSRGLYKEEPLRIFSPLVPNFWDMDFGEFISIATSFLFAHGKETIQGSYQPWTNVITLSTAHDYNNFTYYETMRHELWHAVDDFLCPRSRDINFCSTIDGGVFEKSFKSFLKQTGLTDEEIADYVQYDYPLQFLLTENDPVIIKIRNAATRLGHHLHIYTNLREFVASILTMESAWMVTDRNPSGFSVAEKLPASDILGEEATRVINDILMGRLSPLCQNSREPSGNPFSVSGILSPGRKY